MAGNGGYIKIDRKILDWKWYDDINTKTLFIHCLLRASWKESEWHGHTVHRGQFITSLSNLAAETSLSIQQVRTALKRLKSTGEITEESSTKFRIITVNNYSQYQNATSRTTGKQQTNNKQSNNQSTTVEEYIINNKEGKKGGCAADCPSGDDLPRAENDYIDNYYANR